MVAGYHHFRKPPIYRPYSKLTLLFHLNGLKIFLQQNSIQERSDKREPKVASGSGLKKKTDRNHFGMFDKEISLSKNLFGLCKDPKCSSFVVSDLPMLCWGF